MKPETLDALLIDRELGELAPEVEELLQAYLEADSSAAGRQAGLDTMLRTAREAVAFTPGRSGPGTQFSQLRKRRRWRPAVRIAWPEVLRLAAGLAVGVVLGWEAARGPGAPASDLSLAQRADAAPREVKTTPAGFWSVTRVLAQTHEEADHRQDPGPAGGPRWRMPGRSKSQLNGG